MPTGGSKSRQLWPGPSTLWPGCPSSLWLEVGPVFSGTSRVADADARYALQIVSLVQCEAGCVEAAHCLAHRYVVWGR
jgi:hypothetical protein